MSAFATLSSRQRRVLADMGIDLWIRRAAPIVQADPAEAGAASGSLQPAITVSLDAEPRVAQVELECFAAPGAVVVGAFESGADRRFAQDVLLAAAGAKAAVTRTHFRWPQTQTADVSPRAARSALGGFLRGQTERNDARCLMVFGSAATELLEPSMVSDGCSVFGLPSAAELRGDAARKKALWLTISHLAHR